MMISGASPWECGGGQARGGRGSAAAEVLVVWGFKISFLSLLLGAQALKFRDCIIGVGCIHVTYTIIHPELGG